MMALHSTVLPFDPASGNCVEQLKYYFAANEVADEQKKRSILLSVCGIQTFKLLRNLIDSESLETKSYDFVVKTIADYYDPAPSMIVQRYQFNSRTRAHDESIASYVASLRQLAEYCNYKDTLPDMLRDRIVCGVNHQGMQRRLLAEKDLTYEKAIELAKSMEAAEKGSQAISSDIEQTGTTTPPVHFTSNRSRRPHQGKQATSRNSALCYRCGNDNHSSNSCRFKTSECHKCKKNRTHS